MGLDELRDAFRNWNPDEKARLNEDENEPILGDIKNRKIELLRKATHLWHEDASVELQASIRMQTRIQAEIQLRGDQLRLRSESV